MKKTISDNLSISPFLSGCWIEERSDGGKVLGAIGILDEEIDILIQELQKVKEAHDG